jgi:molecular chaperone GrpE
MSTDPHPHDATTPSEPMPDAANANAALSPEQIMQAATARIAKLETEFAEMKDRWIRAEAETSNARARCRRETDDARLSAVRKFATDIVQT